MIFDSAVMFIMISSIIISLIRGFLKETFTLLSWLIATVATLYSAPFLQKFISSNLKWKMIFDSAIILSIFLIVLIITSIIFSKISKKVKKHEGVFWDEILGALFGVLRGTLLICLSYIFLNAVIYENKPTWLNGKSEPIVFYVSDKLMDLNPKNIKIVNKVKEDKKDVEIGYEEEVRKSFNEIIDKTK